jgi:uncharacterized protein YfaP (DUF2135 family)
MRFYCRFDLSNGDNKAGLGRGPEMAAVWNPSGTPGRYLIFVDFVTY